MLILLAALLAWLGLDLAYVLKIAEPVQMVAGAKDDAAAAPAVAAVRPALWYMRFTAKADGPVAATPAFDPEFVLINKHEWECSSAPQRA